MSRARTGAGAKRDALPAAGARTIAVACGLAALAAIVFGRTIGHQFVALDDGAYVVDNAAVRSGLTLSGIRWAFTTFHESNWHPLTWISHMADISLVGLDPAGHHLTNVVLHAANAAVLFLALRALTREFWPSAWVAAFFAVHPLRAESVAWVSERKDVLSALFFLLGLLAYARYARSPSFARFLPVACCLAAGLMAKPMLVSFPLVLLLLDYRPLGRTGLVRLVKEKAALFVLAFLSCCMTVLAQSGGSAVAPMAQIPFGSRVLNAVGSLGAYVLDLVWPVGLAAIYPHPSLGSNAASDLAASALVGGVIVLAISSAAWIFRRSRAYVTVGWLWYLVMLPPVLGLFQVGIQARADRYTYLPAIGILLAAVWGARDLAAARPRVRPFVVAASGLALVVLAFAGYAQAGVWHDSRSLFTHTLAVTRNNFVIHNNFGVYCLEEADRAAARGDQELERRMVDAARQETESAVRIRPDYAMARSNLGLALQRSGDAAGAEREYREAIRLSPMFTDALCNLGDLQLKEGLTFEAVASFREALRLREGDLEARKALGLALAQSGELGAGIAELERALRDDPRDAQTLNSLGVAYAQSGKRAEAASAFERALAADPDSAEAHNNLGLLAARDGRAADAESHYREALRIRGGYFDARFNLALLLKRRGDAAGAREQFALAAALRPEDARVTAELRALAQAGGP